MTVRHCKTLQRYHQHDLVYFSSFMYTGEKKKIRSPKELVTVQPSDFQHFVWNIAEFK